jgi:dephospho-CoA kinase
MIIGITGTLGAGKGTVVEYLVKTRGFKHFSARAFWNEEIARRGLPSNRDTMTEVANDLRAKYGSDYFVRTALDRAKKAGGNAVLESIRTVGEAKVLKSHEGALWAVDADIKKRYERIAKRASETDSVSFERFVADEKRESENSDPTKQNLLAVIAMADVTIRNDGTVEELHKKVDEILAR